MKKLFISCPMRGRTEEAIKQSMEKMHKIAEIVFGEELEVIDSYINEKPECKRNAIWCLGVSLELMADADYFIGPADWFAESFDGCSIEREVARRYDIPRTHVNCRELMPDLAEIEQRNAQTPGEMSSVLAVGV